MDIDITKLTQWAFEESLKELENIVNRLSTGETNWDELLAIYEAGVTYFKHCESRLGAAEAKIKILSEQLSSLPGAEGLMDKKLLLKRDMKEKQELGEYHFRPFFAA